MNNILTSCEQAEAMGAEDLLLEQIEAQDHLAH